MGRKIRLEQALESDPAPLRAPPDWINTELAVVIFTGYPNLESAVASMKLDAVDYIKKPFNVDEFREVLARVMRKKGLARTPEEQLHKVIGDTIRNLRKEKDLTLKQMSRRTGLSVSLLSQIERAESSASISFQTMRRAAPTIRMAAKRMRRRFTIGIVKAEG